ncbi:MAG: glycosyltransferase family 4 protein [Candidatus Synoicihabitans palmerolidicus]|nr:glycosyltransferase family 4 protein [Candidatus Synoicihabitans palmerolidicus]
MVAPHVQQDARALWEANMLHKFHTAIFDDPHLWRQRCAVRAGRVIGFNFARELRKRTLQELPTDLVSQSSWRELIRLVAGRIDRPQRLGDRIWEWAEPGFDRDVARHCLNRDVEAVFGYEHACLHTLRAAAESGRRRILVIPAPEPGYVKSMLAAELDLVPELRIPLQKQVAAREANRAARRKAEWDLADVIMVASQFTRQSFVEAGWDVSKVSVVPLEAPAPVANSRRLPVTSHDEPLKLIWAGTFSIRKGAHYIIEAWRKYDLGQVAQLSVYGSNGLPDSLGNPIPDGIQLHGTLSRDEPMPLYGQADALLFPTLCDGFGMVATEAWAQGCPVITTCRAGAADLLKDGQNGKLIEARSADAIAEVVTWCHENRDALVSMREPARLTAQARQWSDYRAQVVDTIRTKWEDVPA